MTARCFRLGATAILVVGLASALWIYLSATSSTGDTLGYNPEESRRMLGDAASRPSRFLVN
jgi:hypothetical protein